MMAAAEVQTQIGANTIVLGAAAEQDKFFSIISHSQRGRMDEQRCSIDPSRSSPSTPKHILPTGPTGDQFFSLLSNTQGRRLTDPRVSTLPVIQGSHAPRCSTPLIILSSPVTSRKTQPTPDSTDQTPTEPDSSSKALVMPSAEQDKFFSMISHSQRDRMDEQRCSIDPSRSSPSTPKHPVSASSSTVPSGPEGDRFFRLLANTQGRRLDDQRVSLPALPGIQNGRNTSRAGQDSNYLSYMVSKVQGFCSLPQIHMMPASPSKGPPRSVSFRPGDIERPKTNEKHSQAQVPLSEEDKFFSMISHSQRSRMDEQRCSMDPRSYPSTPKRTVSTFPSGTQNGRSTSKAGQDSNQLCYMVSKVQGSRMDEQRCSAPHILFSAPLRKADSRPKTPTLDVLASSLLNQTPRRSASFSPISEIKRPHSDTNLHKQEVPPAEQDKFFSMISHFQRSRMDEQRCSLDPSMSSSSAPKHISTTPTGPDTEKFFKCLANPQGHRLDDQQVSLPSLPGIQWTSGSCQNVVTNAKGSCVVPQITLTEGTPVTLRKTLAEPGSPRGLPKSASFSPASAYENLQKPPAQMTLRLSMSFTPEPGRKATNQPPDFPDIFLTLAAPGESIVIPLSPSPGRPLSFNLNLVPKEDSHSRSSSPNRARHRQPCSPKPSSPNPGASKQTHRPVSPHRNAQRRHASPGRGAPVTSPVSPDIDIDYFSLIRRVHTAQLQKNMEQGEGDRRGVPGKGKGKGGPGKRKGKGDGRKDKNEGGRKI